MKNIILTIAILFSFNIFAQKNIEKYDSTLAKELGADEYGMKFFCL
jgi:hypothetical protein